MDKEDLKTNKFLTGLLVTALILIAFFAGVYLNHFGLKMPPADDKVMGTWGTFGDYFGGILNPILGFCSFMALLFTIDLQNKQLKKTDEQLEQNRIALDQNAEALKLNNQELQNSNEQLSLSAKAQSEMEKTQRLQQFEGLFTYMANELSKIYGELIDKSKKKSARLFLSNSHGKTYTNVRQSLRSNYVLVRFFMYLYQILKLIDDQSESSMDFRDRKRYSNIIRSSIENDILQLIFLNCLTFDEQDNDFLKYKHLLEKYNFFEHMTFNDKSNDSYNYYFVCLIANYDMNAYDNNYYLRKIPINLIRDIKSNRIDYQLIKKSGNNHFTTELELDNPTITIVDSINSDLATFNLNLLTDVRANYEDFKTSIVFNNLEFIYELPNEKLTIVFNNEFYVFSLIYFNLETKITLEFEYTYLKQAN